MPNTSLEAGGVLLRRPKGGFTMSRHSLRATFVLLVALVLLVPATAGAQTTAPTATPEEKAAAVVRPSMVYIEQYWTAWVRVPQASQLFFEGYVNGGDPFQWATRCSGFIVNPTGYIVTAGHCVDVGKEGSRETALEYAVAWLVQDGWAFRRDAGFWLNEAHLMWGVEGREKGSPADLKVWVQRGVAAGGLKTGEAFPARVLDYQPWSQGDAALLKIEQTDLPTILVAPSAEINVGTPILSVGYPGSTDMVTDASFEPTFKDGQINAQKTREGGLLPVYEMSAALSGGMSGGPTVNLDGNVVGVNSFNINGETEAFNFITPSSLVSEMMAQNGVANELGPIDVAYRAGLDAFYTGDYRTAITKFEEVLALSPTHKQAQEFKVEATKLAATTPKPAEKPAGTNGGGFPAWGMAAIGVGVVVLILLLFLATRRRRPAPASATVVAMPAQPVLERPTAEELPKAVGFQPSATVVGPTDFAPKPKAEASMPAVAGARETEVEWEQPRFCSSCGHSLKADARFCPSCGHHTGG